jgi:hypothetical protein
VISAFGTVSSSPQSRPALEGIGKLPHLSEQTTAKSSIQASKLQHRVTRTRVNVCKLLELRLLQWPLWIRESWFEPRRGNEARQRLSCCRASFTVGRAIGFNLFGLADLIVAVALGIMTSTGPGQVFQPCRRPSWSPTSHWPWSRRS